MPSARLLQKVQLTNLLRQSLIADGLDPDDFAQYFADWKAEGEAGEHLDYYFGKDGFYNAPKREGRRVIKHVHMPPEGSDDLAKWERAWVRRSRKTSDTVLIYAQDPAHGFLLMHLAREPHGHKLAKMATLETQKFMNQLADVAEAFIFNGEILI
jgi:hypothetical protein